jgi:hypothetical protein
MTGGQKFNKFISSRCLSVFPGQQAAPSAPDYDSKELNPTALIHVVLDPLGNHALWGMGMQTNRVRRTLLDGGTSPNCDEGDQHRGHSGFPRYDYVRREKVQGIVVETYSIKFLPAPNRFIGQLHSCNCSTLCPKICRMKWMKTRWILGGLIFNCEEEHPTDWKGDSEWGTHVG